jgi:hypothetical protein
MTAVASRGRFGIEAGIYYAIYLARHVFWGGIPNRIM